MTSYILADCVTCGKETDAVDGEWAVCVRCSDRGLTGKIKAKILQGRMDEAKERRANGERVTDIASAMQVSRRTLYRWLRKGLNRDGERLGIRS